jgi:ATP-dependent Clp protease protease subunit
MFQQYTEQRIVYLSGDVTEQSISSATLQLMLYASVSNKPINFIVSTYGGSVHEMCSLYDTIKFLSCPVHTIGLGKVMSAGVLLLACGEKGKRLIGRSTRIMIHNVSSSAWGNVFDIVNAANEIQMQQSIMFDYLLKETKMTKKQLEDMFNSKVDTYLSAQEAIDLGIADKIIGASS